MHPVLLTFDIEAGGIKRIADPDRGLVSVLPLATAAPDLEAVIGCPLEHTLRESLEPARPDVRRRYVEEWNEGLEIEHRSSVEEVESVDDHFGFVNGHDPSEGERDRVRAPG